MAYNLSEISGSVWKTSYRIIDDHFFSHLILLSVQSYFCVFLRAVMIGTRFSFTHLLTQKSFSLEFVVSPITSLCHFWLFFLFAQVIFKVSRSQPLREGLDGKCKASLC